MHKVILNKSFIMARNRSDVTEPEIQKPNSKNRCDVTEPEIRAPCATEVPDESNGDYPQ
jgi:hypothetical protein